MPDHYCTLEDVNALCPQAPFGAASKPSSAQVEKFITSTALRMDASLDGLGYVTPVVDGTKALALLSEVCAWGAIGLAQMVRETAVSVATGDSRDAKPNIWTQQFEAWMKKIANPQDPFELPDATRTSDPLLKDSAEVMRSHVQSDVDRFVDNPEVTRDQRL